MNQRTQTIEDRVKRIVSEQFGVEVAELSRGTSITVDLNGDSLDQVELIMEIEDEFEMAILDEEAEEIDTIDQMVLFLEGRGVS
jgi:acyl carrier protein